MMGLVPCDILSKQLRKGFQKRCCMCFPLDKLNYNFYFWPIQPEPSWTHWFHIHQLTDSASKQTFIIQAETLSELDEFDKQKKHQQTPVQYLRSKPSPIASSPFPAIRVALAQPWWKEGSIMPPFNTWYNNHGDHKSPRPGPTKCLSTPWRSLMGVILTTYEYLGWSSK